MTQQEKEQAKEFAKKEFSLSEYRQAYYDYDRIIDVAEKTAEWQSQQKQETVELDDVRNQFMVRCNADGYLLSDRDIDEIFNFFAPFIGGSEWTTMESSPKDGSKILAYDINTEDTYIIWWDKNMGNGCWNDLKFIRYPSYWQQLPKAPKEVGG